MASGTYTLTNIKNQHTCVVSWSTSRSSSTSTSVTVSLTLKITCGTYTAFSSPTGDSDLCINGTWDTVGGSGKGGYGGVSLSKGGTWSKTYSKTITWASSSAITCQVYVDYYAGGWGPSGDGGTTQSFTVSVPSYVAYTSPSTPGSLTTGATFYGNLNGGNGNVTVSWSASSGGTNNPVKNYTIQAKYPGGSWYDKWTGTGTSTTLNFDGTAGQEITINLQIRANGTNSSYNSGWRAGSVIAKTISAPGTPSYRRIEYDSTTEVGTQASGKGGGPVSQKIRLQWGSVTGATGYEVRLMRRPTSGTGWEEYSSSYLTTTNNYLDVTLPSRSLYPGTRNNDLWLNVRAVRNVTNKYVTSWVGPYYGFSRSATVRLFDGSSWRNGGVWVYNGGWKPAKKVYIYAAGAWKGNKLFS
jgi:hypothetical protein